jgi:hypothetical protein
VQSGQRTFFLGLDELTAVIAAYVDIPPDGEDGGEIV